MPPNKCKPCNGLSYGIRESRARSLPGTLGRAISLGGVAVQPGDPVVGDVDGVVIVPRDQVQAVPDAADAKLTAERQRLAEIAVGAGVSPWLGATLASAGLPGLGETRR